VLHVLEKLENTNEIKKIYTFGISYGGFIALHLVSNSRYKVKRFME
jgi:alpha-beta hydrolase superfamily lysophospholipase